ncbi:MAG: hypothetical protein P1U32_02745 [Legionellaceae bacterium]|nr:hypothetical protein [Legionellaceae bacterium]
MPNFFVMESNGPGLVDFHFDLTKYVRAFDKKMSAKGQAAKAQAAHEFNEIFTGIHFSFEGLSGATYWERAFTIATQGLTPEQISATQASPAADMMENSFIELIKNSIGEAIERYYDSNKTIPAGITLSLHIDATTHPDKVVIQVTDSGRGFRNQAFLEKLSTEQGQKDYVDKSHGSVRNRSHDRPPLFGGQGRGLRILIADTDGDALEEGGRVHRFTKPEVSRVVFGNALNERGGIRGAQITLITSIEPRENLSVKAYNFKDEAQEIKRSLSESPVSEATTVESSEVSLDLDISFMDDGEEDNQERFQGDSPTLSPVQRKQFKSGFIGEKDTDQEGFSSDEEGDDDDFFSPRALR